MDAGADAPQAAALQTVRFRTPHLSACITQKCVNCRSPTLKQSEFKRWLLARGVVMRHGARHLKLYFNGRQAVLSRQPSKEIGTALRKAILRQLGMDP